LKFTLLGLMRAIVQCMPEQHALRQLRAAETRDHYPANFELKRWLASLVCVKVGVVGCAHDRKTVCLDRNLNCSRDSAEAGESQVNGRTSRS
jgi:hypothetical protein